MSKMNGFEIKNRKIVVKEDLDGGVVAKSLMRDGLHSQNEEHRRMPPGPGPMPPPMPMPGMPPPMPGRLPPPQSGPPPPPPPSAGNFRGSNKRNNMGDVNNQLLTDIVGGGPIGNTVFVANLDYKVTYSKVKEVFKLAGNVMKVDLVLDKDNNSRGMATVTYETSMEAVQAISMFHKQMLYDRPMMVKMDKDNNRAEKDLPSGLQSIGPSLNIPGLESRGPLRDPPLIPSRFEQNSLSELEKLAAQRSLLGGGLNGNLGVSGLGSPVPQINNTNLSGIPGLSKPVGSMLSGGALGLGGLGQQSNSLSGAMGFDSELGGLRANLGGGAGRALDNSLEERSRLLSNSRIPGLGFTDRERIEMDIARVDSRIRDLDRSLAAVEGRKASLGRDNNNHQGGSTVFVRNLPFSLPWQKLRDRFSDVGNVVFCEIKMENGRSKGYGHVKYEHPEQALNAVRRLDGTEIDGRTIHVQMHEEKFSQRR